MSMGLWVTSQRRPAARMCFRAHTSWYPKFVAYSSTCTLHAKKKTTSQMEGTGETPILWVDGRRYNGHTEEADASTTPF